MTNGFEYTFGFTKMHGTGNDFVIIEKSNLPHDADLSRLAKIACDRKFGIGSDGLLIIAPHDEADFEMIFYNHDGSLAEMCGNGIRCLGKYVYEHGLSEKKDLKIQTGAGLKSLKLFCNANGRIGSVEVDMGRPNFNRAEIPVIGNNETALAETLKFADGRELEFHAVSMGNPHAVIIVDNLDNFPVSETGSKVETHEMFPNRTNVEFVEHVSPDYIKIRIWERGAGETLSCGTGICASVAVMQRLGLVKRTVKVQARGGELEVRTGNDDIIYLKGPAVEVYTGIITL